MKKIIATVALFFAMLVLSTTVFAAGSFTGKVTAVDGEKVTVTADNELPGWLQKGTSVSALGGSPKVLEVKGKEVVLKFGKAKAASIKAETPITVSESGDDELQGC